MSPDPRAAALRRALEAVEPLDATERDDVAATVALLEACRRPFDEHAQRDHVTASAFAVSPLGVVLHRHRRLGIWLQPGGHVDAGEEPGDAALRELAEETGVVAAHLAPPALVHVSVHPGPRGHRHFDCRWLVEARTTELRPAPGESAELCWLAPREALARCEPGLVGGLGKALDLARRLGLGAVASWPTVNDALLSLADLDGAIVRARHAVGHPPALVAHDGALAELRELRTMKRELDAEREPLAARAAALEAEATSARTRAAVIAARLDEATGAGRSLEAMVHERDALAARAAQLEDELLELLEQLEPLDARDAALREDAARVATQGDDLALAVSDERARASEELDRLVADRPALAAALEPALLARYESIAARADGVGAARLVDGRCGACHVTVPAAVADRLEHGGDPDAVAVCDECGRLLVR